MSFTGIIRISKTWNEQFCSLSKIVNFSIDFKGKKPTNIVFGVWFNLFDELNLSFLKISDSMVKDTNFYYDNKSW